MSKKDGNSKLMFNFDNGGIEDKTFTRGDRVYFIGDGYYEAGLTYVWAVNMHLMITYYIEHFDGVSPEYFVAKPPFEDGFEAPYRHEFDFTKKYIAVSAHQIEPAEEPAE